jgi:hypothetical protein
MSLPLCQRKKATLGKITSLNTPTNNYTPAYSPSDANTIVSTCAQLTTQNHENQVIYMCSG